MDQRAKMDIVRKKIVFLSLISVIGIPLALGSWFTYAVLTTPDLVDLNKCFTATMNNVKVCPGGGNYTRLDDISEYMKHAVVVSEDAGFWSHSGLDFHELKVSFKVNLKSGRFKRGGSTITQQLVKNIYFSGKKNLTRKVREALLAMRLEKKYSKNQILERYLNLVEFGPDIFGVTQASRHFFSKHPSNLNVLESSYLAFLLPNPKGYYEYFQKGKLTDFSRKMILLISKRLYFYKKISSAEFSHAKANVDRFPWYGVVQWDYSDFEDSELQNMDEDMLEDEFERILEEDIPGEQSVNEASAKSGNSSIEAKETQHYNNSNINSE